ncbi:RNA-directed DNA polymerase, eukaryota, reverse transcriptase zinc-binding domain protein [Tanacetum coccineum]
MVISQSAQVMNLFVESIDGHHRFYCSFVYAHVRTSGRKPLWRELICHSLVVKDEPWLLMGDFNVILDPLERSAGSSYFTSGMEDFRDCLGEMGVEDLCMSGLKFTWNKSPEKFVNSNALFLPFVASDHTPTVVEIPDSHIPGHAMFSVVSKLKLLKKPLRKLKFAQGDLAKKVVESRHELERVQAMMVDDSHNFVLRNKEFECLKVYKDDMRDEESMLKQRAKVSWLSEGDTNTKFFHKTVKGKLNRNRIENVEDMDGLMFSGQHVGDQFMKHFHSVLSKARRVEPIFEPGSLFNKRLSPEVAEFMVRPASWSVIGDEVCTAIGDFFKNGHLLKEVNATIIVLMPKSQTPQKVSDIRPISCCNVLYKAITKIIADRIKGFLGMLVDESQNAFIPSRQISDNVLLTQELMRNYHRNCGPSKVAFKIDIHKAYDFAEWDFMKQCMRGLRQGDSLSPYLFMLVMEVFSLMVKRKIEDDGGFKADVHSVMILSKALIEFSGVSGLVPNLDKSSKNKALSFAGRLQLIKSVVSSIQVYWASTFILPKAVNAEIEQLMRGFLWSHGELRRGHAKVKWKDVCSMKNQGGLGIKSLNIWNISLIAKHIWNVVSKKDSLWVKWVNAYRLIDRSSNVRNFWDIPVLNDSSWGWRKLLQCRDVLREHFVCRIGDGSQTSVWYDNWLSLGPLSQFISNREIYEAGFSLECKVCEVVFNGEWFQMKSRSVKDLCMIIKDVVRFRLLSLKIRSSKQVMEAVELWNLGVEDGNGGRKFGFCMNG